MWPYIPTLNRGCAECRLEELRLDYEDFLRQPGAAAVAARPPGVAAVQGEAMRHAGRGEGLGGGGERQTRTSKDKLRLLNRVYFET